MESWISMCCLWGGSALSGFSFYGGTCWVIMIVSGDNQTVREGLKHSIVFLMSAYQGFWWSLPTKDVADYPPLLWCSPHFAIVIQYQKICLLFIHQTSQHFLSLANWNHLKLFPSISYQISSGSNMSLLRSTKIPVLSSYICI